MDKTSAFLHRLMALPHVHSNWLSTDRAVSLRIEFCTQGEISSPPPMVATDDAELVRLAFPEASSSYLTTSPLVREFPGEAGSAIGLDLGEIECGRRLKSKAESHQNHSRAWLMVDGDQFVRERLHAAITAREAGKIPSFPAESIPDFVKSLSSAIDFEVSRQNALNLAGRFKEFWMGPPAVKPGTSAPKLR